ncbi:tetratricopeptide repeat protein [Nocardioides mesophilus]|uniref:Tetratricopeptide repeat protein n=1 Tax=Nocardioides mesophilus TaxID=433659 RepID=A0A7G9RAI5_9ACTN|nr:tetratricopeptide repeat protein [Nocardioides mesophilus]QNN52610.1 tetratricopeptide repeat protein [Nocardioides mesophilus]
MVEARGQGPRRGGDRPRSGDRARGTDKPRGGATSAAGGRRDSSRGESRGESRDRRPGQDRTGNRRAGDREERTQRVDQETYDGPPLNEEITGRELGRDVLQQLKGLPEKLATRVARHLVAAAELIDDDPQTAYRHTLAARARASRIAVVREACGEAAYHAGEYAEALSELRAAKRMNGNTDYLAVMADCERALGRPEKALALAQSPAVPKLEDSLKAEMTIVEAGARRDLGELDSALRTLENAPLRSQSRADWVVRLRYAYADTLAAAGRTAEAIEWFHRTVGADGNEITDAAERAAELERQTSA